jgi:hypothetical protein
VVARISQLSIDLAKCRFENPQEADLFHAEVDRLRRDTDLILCRFDSFRSRWTDRPRRRMASVERRLRVLELNLLYVLPAPALIARVPGMRAKLKRHIRTSDPRYDLFSRMPDRIAAQAETASDEPGPPPAVARSSRHIQL